MMDRGLGQFITLGASKVISAALAILTTLLVGRLLGPVAFGRWILIAAAGTLLHTALVNWTHGATVRFGREEWAQSGSLNRTLGARLPVLATAVVLTLVVVGLQPANWGERWFALEAAERWLLAVVALSAWLSAEAQATLQASDRITWQAVVAPVVAGASVLAVLVLFRLDFRSLTATALALTAPVIVGWGSTWVVSIIRSNTSIAELSAHDLPRHLRYGAPLIPTLILGYASDWGDHLLLTRFSTMAQVGLFALSYQLFVAAMAANGVLVTLLLPRLVAQEIIAPGAMRAYLTFEVPTLYALWMLATVWLVAILPIAVGPALGSAFDASVPVLLVLLVAIPSSVVTSFYTVLFNMQERMGRVLGYIFLMTATNVVLSALLIPRLGAIGAAAGTAVSYVLGQALYIRDQHRQLQVPADAVWTMSAAGIILGVSQLAVGPGAVGRIAWAVVATAVLMMVMRRLRCVDAGVVARLFAGRLSVVGELIAVALAPRRQVANS